jgi:hypothetical protein
MVLWHKRFLIKFTALAILLYSFSVSVSYASSRLSLLTPFLHAAAQKAGFTSMEVRVRYGYG